MYTAIRSFTYWSLPTTPMPPQLAIPPGITKRTALAKSVLKSPPADSGHGLQHASRVVTRRTLRVLEARHDGVTASTGIPRCLR